MAVTDLNAEAARRRQRQRAAIEQAGDRVTHEPTPIDRLRSDFDLGPADYEFSSLRGWDYGYAAEANDELACVFFAAPSGHTVSLTFVPMMGSGQRDVRLVAIVDDVRVNEKPFLTARQFPEPIMQMVQDAIADLNAESEERLASRRRTLESLG